MSSPPAPGGPSMTPGVNDIPVCPRHPQVAAYTRCQRCGRPACTSCQVPASVGFQCVDCVDAERRANPVPAQRSSLGFPEAPGRPLVTYAIIAICVAVWVGEKMSEDFFGRVAYAGILGYDEPWRYITSGFAHDTSQLLHLPFNMMALYYMGQYLEPLLGRVRFACLYLLSVLGGSVLFQILTGPSSMANIHDSDWFTPLIGASGGIFGLFLAVLVLNRHLGREIGSMVTLIGINVVLGFTMPGVAWQAHFGGALVGAATAGLLFFLRRRPAAVQYGAMAALAVALYAAAYIDYAVVGFHGIPAG